MTPIAPLTLMTSLWMIWQTHNHLKTQAQIQTTLILRLLLPIIGIRWQQVLLIRSGRDKGNGSQRGKELSQLSLMLRSQQAHRYYRWLLMMEIVMTLLLNIQFTSMLLDVNKEIATKDTTSVLFVQIIQTLGLQVMRVSHTRHKKITRLS